MLPGSSLQLSVWSTAEPVLHIRHASLPSVTWASAKAKSILFSSAFSLSHLGLARVSIELKPIGSAPLKCLNQQGKVTARKSRWWDQAEQGRDAGEVSEQDDRHGAGRKFTATGLGSGPPFYYILHRAS